MKKSEKVSKRDLENSNTDSHKAIDQDQAKVEYRNNFLLRKEY